MDRLLNNIRNLKNNPEIFLKRMEHEQEILQIIGHIYSITTKYDFANEKSGDILPEIIMEQMDGEQIWQQMDIRNAIVYPQYLDQSANILALREHKLEIKLKEEDSGQSLQSPEAFEQQQTMQEEEEDEDLEDSDFNDRMKTDTSGKKLKDKKVRGSVVDDKFFNLHEMEKFLEMEDTKEIRKHNGSSIMKENDIDYFAADDSSHDEENQLNYGDFYSSDEEPNSEKSAINANMSPEINTNIDSNDPGELDADCSPDNSLLASEAEKSKSSYEFRQERLKKRIEDYENEVLGEKPWQLKGETVATSRPQNSLLEEILEFESTVRPAPIITEETTRRLEDLIRQRIKDQAWDDVELKIRPTQTPQDFRKQIVLNQEKSKESLAQIYEKEYQRELSKHEPSSSGHMPDGESGSKEHDDIRLSMRTLFNKLDTIFHFYFSPKPVAPEARIITNTPALQMEDMLPTAVSDAHLLAPEEIYRAPKKALLGKSEQETTDKNRERRKKKLKQRAIHKALTTKDVVRQKLGIPLSQKEEKAKMLKKMTKQRNIEMVTAGDDFKSIKSSKQFFSRLEETTKAATKNTTKPAKSLKHSSKVTATTMSAKKIKL